LHIYKKILKHKNIIYILGQNKVNSRHSTVFAEATLTIVAKIDNKTNKIEYLIQNLPPKVVKIIEWYAIH
jgi:hypothetical protein